MRSMTAFGNHRLELNGELYLWELRSVNHRYLEVQLRLPEGYRTLEEAARAHICRAIRRGKLEAVLRISGEQIGATGLQISTQKLDRLKAALHTVHSRFPDATTDALDLLRWPGVIVNSTPQADELTEKALLDALDHALTDITATREREGKSLHQLIDKRAQRISEAARQVRVKRDDVLERQRQRLRQSLAALDCAHDPGRLEQEIVYAAQRLDIDEELDRLDHHLAELLQVMQRDEPVGRRLDFILQELNREANTLGSKASDSQALDAVIEMKVLIEQMREQVQNVE